MSDTVMLVPLHSMGDEFLNFVMDIVSLFFLIVPKQIGTVPFKVSGIFRHMSDLTRKCLFSAEIVLYFVVCRMLRHISLSNS